MKHQVVLLLLMCMMLGTASAAAQDKGRVGMAMGFPGSIAAIWHLTEAIAIRPEVGLARDSTTTSAGNTTTSLTTTVGVSGIFFVASHDSLRTYVSPQFGYSRASITTKSSSPSFPDVESPASVYTAGGSVGAQYALGRRFSAYGELGVTYRHSEGGVSKFVTNAIWNRSAVGVIVYF